MDEFRGEQKAMRIRTILHEAIKSRELPIASDCKGFSPAAERYEQVHADVQSARYNKSDGHIRDGWKTWVQSLGTIRRIEFYVLPENVVKFEVSGKLAGMLQHRVGHWQLEWDDTLKLVAFVPDDEHVISSPEPYFRDVTATVFQGETSFQEQFSRGIPYWRASLDPATGIDVYGSNGVAVGDIDGDGADEIYVCQPGGLPNRLYRVSNESRLIDITKEWNVGLLDDTSCALFLDLRNIGRQDLVVLRSGGPELFLNEGNTYRRKEDAFRFANAPAGGFTGMAAADFDRDGKLDLYLCCYVYFQSEAQFTYASPYYDAQNGPPNFLFRNLMQPDGTGWLQDCTTETGIHQNNNRFSFAPAWCDFNDDGWPDLFVANDFGRKNLYVNKGGHFTDLAQDAGVEDIGPGMSASWFDYNGDGRADLYVANMWSDVGQRVVRDSHFLPAHKEKARTAYELHTRGNSLYQNRGDGSFEDVSDAQHATFGRWAWSSGGHDLDNDGNAELVVTCGMLTNTSRKDLMGFFWRQVVAKSPDEPVASSPYQNGWNAINQFVREDYSWSGHEPNVVHVRRGNRFFDASGISGIDFADDSRAFAVLDFDGDGRPDIILKSRLGPQVRVLQNNCSSDNHSIAFRLVGTQSNRDAIGAKVQVDSQTKWMEAGSGFLSQHSKRIIFGLGNAAVAQQIKIYWPSGHQQTFSNLAAGRTYLITEGRSTLKSELFRQHKPLTASPVAADNHMALRDTWLAEPLPLPEPQTGPALLVLYGTGATTVPAGLPVIKIDLTGSNSDRRRKYEVFRRYLFDWRATLQTPLSLLLNTSGQVVKVYGEIPSLPLYRADIARIASHAQLALPFPGYYIGNPQRDFFKFGVAFLWAGFPDEALPYLQEKLKRSPNNARVLTLVAQLYISKKDFAAAEQAFFGATRIDPKSPESFYGLGLALAKQDRLEEARGYFQQAIALRPAYPEAINDLGALYIQSGKTDDAVAAFRYGIKMSPDEDILYLNLARTYVRLGQLDRAREIMQQLLDRKPDSTAARHGLQELNGR